jgi:hypothetical protein
MGVRVIFATHSPTTIALAPEESIYQLENSNFSHKLKKVSKDEALALLTSELPFLNISHENKRQIFVESHNDATYYNQIFNFLKKKLNPNIFLNFISSGGEKSKEAGNSNQVNRLVNDLRNAGNKSVYGLIDWDKCNQDKPFIFVAGLNNRYSLENYLYDPILLICLFTNLGIAKFEDFHLERVYKVGKVGQN